MVHGGSHGEVAGQKIALLNSSCSKALVLSWEGWISELLFWLLFTTSYPFLCNFAHCNSEILLTTYIFTKKPGSNRQVIAFCALLLISNHGWVTADNESWLAGLQVSKQCTDTSVELLKVWPVCWFWAVRAASQSASKGVFAAQGELSTKSGQERCRVHERAQECSQKCRWYQGRLSSEVSSASSPFPQPSAELSMNLAPWWVRLPTL